MVCRRGVALAKSLPLGPKGGGTAQAVTEGLETPQSASLTAPLRSKGSLLDSGMPQGVALAKSLPLEPKGRTKAAASGGNRP